jgi:hypothetical protein
MKRACPAFEQQGPAHRHFPEKRRDSRDDEETLKENLPMRSLHRHLREIENRDELKFQDMEETRC